MVAVNHHKICTASVIHPNPALVCAPAIALGARGIAMLCDQPHLRASRFHAAVVPSHVVGVTRNRLRIAIVMPVPVINAAITIHVANCHALILKDGISPNRKIRAASVVNPNTSFIGAPAVPFVARGVAMLR